MMQRVGNKYRISVSLFSLKHASALFVDKIKKNVNIFYLSKTFKNFAVYEKMRHNR
jgi:hypothetical protein